MGVGVGVGSALTGSALLTVVLVACTMTGSVGECSSSPGFDLSAEKSGTAGDSLAAGVGTETTTASGSSSMSLRAEEPSEAIPAF